MRQRMEMYTVIVVVPGSQADNSKYNSASSAQSSAVKSDFTNSYSKPGGSAPSSEMSSAFSDRSRGSAGASSWGGDGGFGKRQLGWWWRRLVEEVLAVVDLAEAAVEEGNLRIGRV